MNADEVVKALRDWNEQYLSVMCASDCAPQCYEYCDGVDCIAVRAADCIESLQAQLADKTALIEATIAGQETLQKALNRRAQPENEPHNNEPLTRCENCTRWDKSITFMGAHACAYWSPSRKEPRYTEWFEFCSFAEAKA